MSNDYDPAVVADFDQDMAFCDQAIEAHMAMLHLIRLLPGAPTDEMVIMGLLISGITQAITEAEKLDGGVAGSNLPKIYARLVYKLNEELKKK